MITDENITKIYGQFIVFNGTEFTDSCLLNGLPATGVTLASAGIVATGDTGFHSIVPTDARGAMWE